jgi:succinoglycan biosynthesis transport protein ExoP
MANEAEKPHGPVGGWESPLRDYFHVLVRRRRVVLAVFVGVVALAALRTLLTRPVYEATSQILIERTDPAVLSFKEVAPVDAGRDDYYQTQYKLLQSRSLAERVIETLGLLNDPEYGGPRAPERIASIESQPPGQSPEMEAAIDALLARLSVRPVRNSRLVTVSVASYRPELAASVTNGVARTYIAQSLDTRFQTSSEAGDWLRAQIEDQRKKVESLDRQLQELKKEEGLVNIEERRPLLDQRLEELGTALNETKTERLQKEALWRQMAAARNPEELPEVMRSPLVQSLRIELASLERRQAQLLERYLDRHPEVVEVREQIADTRVKIRAEAQRVVRAAENDYKAAAAQEASISRALETAKQEALELQSRAVGYDSRKRELDAAQQVLNSLLSRAKEADVASQLESSNIRIVDQAAVPKRPARPRTVRDIAFGILLGALLGVGAGVLLESLDNTLKTPDDVRVHLGVPLLGVIPEHRTRSESERVVSDPRAEGPFVEGYRVIRTALQYSWPDPGPRILVVTSTSPWEGKTLTAVNLALTLASSEDRVLLIDADLRKPKTHSLLRTRRVPGLSDVIVGKVKPSQAIVPQVPRGELAFLPAGTSVPSPADLLTNRTMRSLLDGLRRFYDWIVIDTPPVGAVAEPMILAPLADGVVVVGGAEMVPRKAVMQTLERIHDTGARVLGLVLNRAQVERHAYYYRHYYGQYYGKYSDPKRGPHAHNPKVTDIASRRRA